MARGWQFDGIGYPALEIWGKDSGPRKNYPNLFAVDAPDPLTR